MLAVTQMFAAHKIIIVGDSTSLGFYDAVVWGLFKGVKPSNLTFVRCDRSPWLPEADSIREADLIVMNFGAHEAKQDRFTCPVPHVDYIETYHDISDGRHVQKSRLTAAFHTAMNRSVSYHTQRCYNMCQQMFAVTSSI